MVLALASVVLLILNRAVLHGPEAIGPELVIVPGFATVGAVVAARHRGRGIGWWFLALALCAAVREGVSQYAVRALITAPGSLVAGVWMAWLSNATWVVPFALVGFVLLLFPDGWLPSPRWRPVAWALAVCTGLLTLAGAVDPHPVDLSGVGAVSNPLGIERLRSATPILGLVFFVDMAALLASAAAPVLRFRRATCDERQQLAWVGYGHLAGNRAGPPHHPHRRGPRLRRRPAHRLSVVRRPRQGAALPIRARARLHQLGLPARRGRARPGWHGGAAGAAEEHRHPLRSRRGPGVRQPSRQRRASTSTMARRLCRRLCRGRRGAHRSVVVPLRAFQHWDDARHAWRTEPGTFHLHVGPSSGDLPCTPPSRSPAADARRSPTQLCAGQRPAASHAEGTRTGNAVSHPDDRPTRGSSAGRTTRS